MGQRYKLCANKERLIGLSELVRDTEKAKTAGVWFLPGLINRLLCSPNPLIASETMRRGRGPGQTKGETMSKTLKIPSNRRVIWAVEFFIPKVGWCIWSRWDTRKDARHVKHVSGELTTSRVVKYVPAESGKKAGGK